MTKPPRTPVIGSRWQFADRYGSSTYELVAEHLSNDPDRVDWFTMRAVELSGNRQSIGLGYEMQVERAWFEHRTDARRIA